MELAATLSKQKKKKKEESPVANGTSEFHVPSGSKSPATSFPGTFSLNSGNSSPIISAILRFEKCPAVMNSRFPAAWGNSAART